MRTCTAAEQPIFHSFIFRNEMRCFCHQKKQLTHLLYYCIILLVQMI